MERPMIPKHSIRYFEGFCQLPPELRIKIYMFMVEPRIINLRYCPKAAEVLSSTDVPAILHVCQEARILGLMTYQPCFGTTADSVGIYINFNLDTVVFDWASLERYGPDLTDPFTLEPSVGLDLGRVKSLLVETSDIGWEMDFSRDQKEQVQLNELGYFENLEVAYISGCNDPFIRLGDEYNGLDLARMFKDYERSLKWIDPIGPGRQTLPRLKCLPVWSSDFREKVVESYRSDTRLRDIYANKGASMNSTSATTAFFYFRDNEPNSVPVPHQNSNQEGLIYHCKDNGAIHRVWLPSNFGTHLRDVTHDERSYTSCLQHWWFEHWNANMAGKSARSWHREYLKADLTAFGVKLRLLPPNVSEDPNSPT